MSRKGPTVRDLIPRERISEGRIREALGRKSDLSDWSRGAAGAIRPSLFARVIRDCLWENLDVPIAEVREKLTGCKACRYGLTLEVETAPDRCHEIQATLDLRLSDSQRVSAELQLLYEGQVISVTSGSVLLAANLGG